LCSELLHNISAFLFPHTELTPAILLIIEIVLLDDGNTTFAQSTFAPILFPPNHIGIMRSGIMSGFVDLLQAFPSAGSKGGGDDRETVFVGITGSVQQAHLEATKATSSPLRFLLHPFDVTEPVFVIIIGIHYLQAKGLGIAGTFVFTDVVLFQRIDIGIAIINDGGDTMLHQALDDGRRAGSTTSMEEHFIGSSRYFELEFLFLHLLRTGTTKAIRIPSQHP